MMFAPFCLFPEEMFLRAAIFGMTVIAAVVIPVVWYIVRRVLKWASTKDLNRMLEKEAAIREMGTTRVWH